MFTTVLIFEMILHIIMSFISAKVIVLTGLPDGHGGAEMIDFFNSENCHLQSINFTPRHGSIGGVLNNQIMICGGKTGSFSDNQYLQDGFIIGQDCVFQRKWFNMIQKRTMATSVMIKRSKVLWIVGGFDGSKHLQTSEFINFNGNSILGPSLPFTITEHAMIQFDLKSIFIIGGYQDGVKSNQTWIADPTNGFSVQRGPPLNIARSLHLCGKMESNGKTWIIVAGGCGLRGYLSSVELLDPVSGKMWIYGKKSSSS